MRSIVYLTLCLYMASASEIVSLNGNLQMEAKAGGSVVVLAPTRVQGLGVATVSSLAAELVDINANMARLEAEVADGCCTVALDSISLVGDPVALDMSPWSETTLVRNDVTVSSNSALASLTGLNRLCTVKRHITIHSNPVMTSLNGLSRLTIVNGDLDLENLGALISLRDLGSLLTVDGNLRLSQLQHLGSLTGLELLGSVGGNFHLELLPSLTTLGAASSLTTIGGNLQLSSLTQLSSLSLDSLQLISGSLSITDADLVTTSFPALQRIEGNALFSIGSTAERLSLPLLTHITGNLQISLNTNLHTVDAFAVASLGGTLRITFNALTSLSFLDSLRSFSGPLDIWEPSASICNSTLVRLTALASSASVNVGQINNC